MEHFVHERAKTHEACAPPLPKKAPAVSFPITAYHNVGC